MLPCTMVAKFLWSSARLTQEHERSARQASVLQVEDSQAATDPERSRYKRSRVVQQGSVPCIKILKRARLEGDKTQTQHVQRFFFLGQTSLSSVSVIVLHLETSNYP